MFPLAPQGFSKGSLRGRALPFGKDFLRREQAVERCRESRVDRHLHDDFDDFLAGTSHVERGDNALSRLSVDFTQFFPTAGVARRFGRCLGLSHFLAFPADAWDSSICDTVERNEAVLRQVLGEKLHRFKDLVRDFDFDAAAELLKESLNRDNGAG